MSAPCLIWIGAFDRKGFPCFKREGEIYSALRVAWLLTHGEEPPCDREVYHTCPSMACVEPTHLMVGEPTIMRVFKPIPRAVLNSEDRFWESAA